MPTLIKEDCLTEDKILASVASNLDKLNLGKFKFGENNDKAIYPVIWQSLGRIKGCNDARGWLKRRMSKVMGKVGKSLDSFIAKKSVSQFDATVNDMRTLLRACNDKSKLKGISEYLVDCPFTMVVLDYSLPTEEESRKKIIAWVNEHSIGAINQFQSLVDHEGDDKLRQLLENYSATVETKLETMATKIGRQASATKKKLERK